MSAIQIGIVMGSSSDWDTMAPAADILTEFGVAFECRVVSAHRMPDDLFAYADSRKGARAASHHRGCGWRGAPARHAGCQDHGARAGGAGRVQTPQVAWTPCTALCKCPKVFRSLRLPSGRRVQPTPRYSPWPCWRCINPRWPML